MKNLQLSIPDVIDYLALHFKYAEHADRKRLADLINVPYGESEKPPGFELGQPIDMLVEVQEQMQMVRLLRAQITSLGANANPKDLQALVSTSTSLFAMLTKYSDQMINQERIKKIELSVAAAIKTLDLEVQEAYFDNLERLLSE